MTKKRIVAVIIVRDGRVVQSEKFKHTNVIHYDAIHAIDAFSKWDVDEIVLLNVSKNKSTQADFIELVRHVSKRCFVPLTVGGFIDTVVYGEQLIKNGADKLVINTAFYSQPYVPAQLSAIFGRQCIVASIDVNFDAQRNEHQVLTHQGKNIIGEYLRDWIGHVHKCGAGELFLNNVDFDGNRQGYDLEMLKIARAVTKMPIIMFGGAALEKHFAAGLDYGADAVAAANIFHYKEMATRKIKRYLARSKYNVRTHT